MKGVQRSDSAKYAEMATKGTSFHKTSVALTSANDGTSSHKQKLVVLHP